MKHPLSFAILLLCFISLSCQRANEQYITKTATEDGYTYEYVTNDESNTRIYTLDNGLKVYLSVYKDAPRIFTFIPVKAGGKFDPANSTGLAHYLEHMMFKGTGQFGTKDWEQEKVMVDSIEQMFEYYRTLTDPEERKTWYAKIDQYSGEAAKLAIANEYDKMMAYIGAKGTNAYTTEDRTVYVNDIPANQIDNFLQIESERFSTIVNRLFHTELEAVYEEKNRSLDNDYWKVQETMMSRLFTSHPYGTQTVIGTIEHLKNPSITDINAYFDKYYVPNNMAVCMSGDFDPSEVIQLVDRYFGRIPSQPLDAFTPPQEAPIKAPIVDTVYGPDAEFVNIGFRFGGFSSDDYAKIQMVDYLLNNSSAGLIDLNLVQKQKILSGGTYVNGMNDYSMHIFRGQPREGQSLKEVQELLLSQLELLKKGEFEDWLMEAVINDFKKGKMQGLENNYSRANDMVMAFTNDMPWKEYISQIDQMAAITKEELMQFVQDHYSDNYVAIYKLTGEDPNKQRVEKPQITKVDVDRTTKSAFFTAVENKEVPAIQPVFVDYDQDIKKSTLQSDIPLLYKENKENSLFSLYYLLDFGTNENPMMEMALEYLKYLGTAKMDNAEFNKELYKLGCSFSVFSSTDRTYVTLSGLDENMEPAIQLIEQLLTKPVADEEVLKNMISDMHKQRSDIKKNKGAILFSGLMNYAKYGPNSPFTNVLSNEALDQLTSEKLIRIIQDILQTEHRILYYGPRGVASLTELLNEQHQSPASLKPAPAKKEFAKLDTDDSKVFFTDYDMVQAEIIFQSKGPQFDPSIAPEARLFNEYFGGGMSGIVFQEIREAQGLAYSVFSNYNQGVEKGENDYMMAYVGTQADKQKEAMGALMDLINNLPESPQNFDNAQKSILKKIESERVTKTSVLFNYLSAQEKGLDYDIRKDIYERVQKMTFEDLKSFHNMYVKDKKYNVAIIGSEDKIDFVALNEYGEVVKLSLSELFGYEDRDPQLLN
jgi:zinc protease